MTFTKRSPSCAPCIVAVLLVLLWGCVTPTAAVVEGPATAASAINTLLLRPSREDDPLRVAMKGIERSYYEANRTSSTNSSSSGTSNSSSSDGSSFGFSSVELLGGTVHIIEYTHINLRESQGTSTASMVVDSSSQQQYVSTFGEIAAHINGSSTRPAHLVGPLPIVEQFLLWLVLADEEQQKEQNENHSNIRELMSALDVLDPASSWAVLFSEMYLKPRSLLVSAVDFLGAHQHYDCASTSANIGGLTELPRSVIEALVLKFGKDHIPSSGTSSSTELMANSSQHSFRILSTSSLEEAGFEGGSLLAVRGTHTRNVIFFSRVELARAAVRGAQSIRATFSSSNNATANEGPFEIYLQEEIEESYYSSNNNNTKAAAILVLLNEPSPSSSSSSSLASIQSPSSASLSSTSSLVCVVVGPPPSAVTSTSRGDNTLTRANCSRIVVVPISTKLFWQVDEDGQGENSMAFNNDGVLVGDWWLAEDQVRARTLMVRSGGLLLSVPKPTFAGFSLPTAPGSVLIAPLSHSTAVIVDEKDGLFHPALYDGVTSHIFGFVTSSASNTTSGINGLNGLPGGAPAFSTGAAMVCTENGEILILGGKKSSPPSSSSLLNSGVTGEGFVLTLRPDGESTESFRDDGTLGGWHPYWRTLAAFHADYLTHSSSTSTTRKRRQQHSEDEDDDDDGGSGRRRQVIPIYPRYFHCMVAGRGSTVYVSGGIGGGNGNGDALTSVLDDFWEFNPREWAFQKKFVSEDQGRAPRYGHRAVFFIGETLFSSSPEDTDWIIIVGGIEKSDADDDQDQDVIQLFSIYQDRMYALSAPREVARLKFHTLHPIGGAGRFLVFGGSFSATELEQDTTKQQHGWIFTIAKTPPLSSGRWEALGDDALPASAKTDLDLSEVWTSTISRSSSHSNSGSTFTFFARSRTRQTNTSSSSHGQEGMTLTIIWKPMVCPADQLPSLSGDACLACPIGFRPEKVKTSFVGEGGDAELICVPCPTGGSGCSEGVRTPIDPQEKLSVYIWIGAILLGVYNFYRRFQAKRDLDASVVHYRGARVFLLNFAENHTKAFQDVKELRENHPQIGGVTGTAGGATIVDEAKSPLMNALFVIGQTLEVYQAFVPHWWMMKRRNQENFNKMKASITAGGATTSSAPPSFTGFFDRQSAYSVQSSVGGGGWGRQRSSDYDGGGGIGSSFDIDHDAPLPIQQAAAAAAAATHQHGAADVSSVVSTKSFTDTGGLVALDLGLTPATSLISLSLGGQYSSSGRSRMVGLLQIVFTDQDAPALATRKIFFPHLAKNKTKLLPRWMKNPKVVMESSETVQHRQDMSEFKEICAESLAVIQEIVSRHGGAVEGLAGDSMFVSYNSVSVLTSADPLKAMMQTIVELTNQYSAIEIPLRCAASCSQCMVFSSYGPFTGIFRTSMIGPVVDSVCRLGNILRKVARDHKKGLGPQMQTLFNFTEMAEHQSSSLLHNNPVLVSEEAVTDSYTWNESMSASFRSQGVGGSLNLGGGAPTGPQPPTITIRPSTTNGGGEKIAASSKRVVGSNNNSSSSPGGNGELGGGHLSPVVLDMSLDKDAMYQASSMAGSSPHLGGTGGGGGGSSLVPLNFPPPPTTSVLNHHHSGLIDSSPPNPTASSLARHPAVLAMPGLQMGTGGGGGGFLGSGHAIHRQVSSSSSAGGFGGAGGPASHSLFAQIVRPTPASTVRIVALERHTSWKDGHQFSSSNLLCSLVPESNPILDKAYANYNGVMSAFASRTTSRGGGASSDGGPTAPLLSLSNNLSEQEMLMSSLANQGIPEEVLMVLNHAIRRQGLTVFKTE